jgi:hypothetical protein
MMKGSREVRFGTHIAGNGFKGGGGAVQYLKRAFGGAGGGTAAKLVLVMHSMHGGWQWVGRGSGWN